MSISVKEMNHSHTEEEAVLQQLQRTLLRYCRSLPGMRQEAEDLAQDAWLKALAASNGAVHANPEALLLRVAKNSWVDQVRRQAVYAGLIKRHSPASCHPGAPFSTMVEDALHVLLIRLTPQQLAVFLLRDVCGYNVADAALQLHLTEGAVKAAHHRARRALPNVQRDLALGGLAEPQQEGFKALLRALASCYERGDIDGMLQVVLRAEHIADSDAVSYLRTTGSSSQNSRQPEARLAA